jgi:predicted DNA-binding transcriptional regulator AlpA
MVSVLTAEMLTTQQVADILGVTRWTLAYWRAQRTGPPFMLITRGCVRYQRAALETWLRAHVHAEGERKPAWGRK